MSENPWPSASVACVLFIIDAAHEVEQDILESWLQQTRSASDFDGRVEMRIVPIAKDPEAIDASTLFDTLQLPDETVVIPIRVVWITAIDNKSATPRLTDLLWGNPRRPGSSEARKILKNHPQRVHRLEAASATLANLKSRFQARFEREPAPESFADFVAGQAGLALDIAERQRRGGRYKVPRQVAKNLQSSEKFKTALAQVAQETGRSTDSLLEEAQGIFKELIAVPRTFWQDTMAVFNRKLISMGYEKDFVVDPVSMERVRKIIREQPSAILWSHKTHVDGFAVYSMLFENDVPTPHLLGGVNMAFAGLGYAARRAGGIFIRRSFQNDPLYKMILRQYLGYLLEKRFPLSWAFEGTRSRVGKLMPPKYGLVKYVAEAAHATGTRNLHIIPVAINYDLIGDVEDYVAEQSGARKRPESLRWFLGYLRGLRKPLGRIYIDFGEPVVLENPPSGEDLLMIKKIALQVGVEVNKVSPITVPSVMTMILLGASPRALTRDELINEITQLLTWAHDRKIRITGDFDRSQRIKTEQAVKRVVDNGLITRYDEGPEVVYTIEEKQHRVAGYYRNTTIHHFVIKAITELALFYTARHEHGNTEIFWQEADLLRDIFKFEFFYSPKEQFHQEVNEELSRYEAYWESDIDGDPDNALKLLESFKPLVAHATLLSFVEAYRVVFNVVASLGPDESIDEEKCVELSMAYGQQAYLQRRITSACSIGKILFQNGFKTAHSMGLTDADTDDVGTMRDRMSRKFRNLARRLDRIRGMALPDML